MMQSNISQENIVNPQSMGPGDRLQAARIENGLSIEDVATRMHLSIGILGALEENNFDDITAPIFVKGYLRAYARIVSLDEDEMIQQYQNYYSEEDPPVVSKSKLTPEISSDDARIRWTTYLVIIGLLGLIAAWWWSQYQIKADLISLDAGQTNSIQQPETVADIAETEIKTPADASLSAVEETDISLLVVDEPEVTDLTVVAETQEPVSLQPAEAEIEEVAQQDVVQEEVETSKLERLSEEVSRIAPMGSEQLTVVIHADTWVDIKDASGHLLVYELLRAEQEINLTGKAPFAVFLGNGHGVELIYKNEAIDISGRIRDDNTARIRIGS